MIKLQIREWNFDEYTDIHDFLRGHGFEHNGNKWSNMPSEHYASWDDETNTGYVYNDNEEESYSNLDEKEFMSRYYDL